MRVPVNGGSRPRLGTDSLAGDRFRPVRGSGRSSRQENTQRVKLVKGRVSEQLATVQAGARQVQVLVVLTRGSVYFVMQVNTGCCSAMRGECAAAVNACRLLIGGPE
jgi:hypothetical protein